MKTLIIAVLLVAASSLQARVGETRTQITARYGKGELSDYQRLSGAETMKYHHGNFQIEVVFADDKSIWEIIKREDHLIDKDDIKLLLEANKDPGTTWTFKRRDGQWQRSGEPKLVAYLWPQHEDFFCIKNPDACDAVGTADKTDKLKGF
jgi:hypothetical protein